MIIFWLDISTLGAARWRPSYKPVMWMHPGSGLGRLARIDLLHMRKLLLKR